jgi:hypothetical protein
MRKKIVLVVVLAAILLYIGNSYILPNLFGSGKRSIKQNPAALKLTEMALSNPVVHFEKKGRNPFTAFQEKPKPVKAASAVDQKSRSVKTRPVPANPPKISVTGIMWHPTNPIVMITLPNGSSSTAKTGQTIDSIKFVKIEKSRVLVEVKGNEFWIAK